MKKILSILAAVCVSVGGFTVTNDLGGKFYKVYDGYTHYLPFMNYVGSDNIGVAIKLLDNDHDGEDVNYLDWMCKFQVWYSSRDEVTQFAALLSEGYDVSNVSFESSVKDGYYYMRFDCVNMAIKLLNDNHILDIK